MHRLAAAAVIFAASPALARPTLGIVETVGYGGTADELSYHWRLEPGGFVRFGSWQITASIPTLFGVASSDPARDSDSLVGFAFEARAAYHVALVDHAEGSVSLGLAREWLLGDGTVTRPCRLTGACLAGYTMESPSYSGWMPELRIGVGPSYALPDGLFAASFELIVDAHRLDVPPHGLRDVSVLGGVSFAFGWHPRARTPRGAP